MDIWHKRIAGSYLLISCKDNATLPFFKTFLDKSYFYSLVYAKVIVKCQIRAPASGISSSVACQPGLQCEGLRRLYCLQLGEQVSAVCRPSPQYVLLHTYLCRQPTWGRASRFDCLATQMLAYLDRYCSSPPSQLFQWTTHFQAYDAVHAYGEISTCVFGTSACVRACVCVCVTRIQADCVHTCCLLECILAFGLHPLKTTQKAQSSQSIGHDVTLVRGCLRFILADANRQMTTARSRGREAALGRDRALGLSRYRAACVCVRFRFGFAAAAAAAVRFARYCVKIERGRIIKKDRLGGGGEWVREMGVPCFLSGCDK